MQLTPLDTQSNLFDPNLQSELVIFIMSGHYFNLQEASFEFPEVAHKQSPSVPVTQPNFVV